MPGTTTHGYPYVTPTDHPKEYPAASQALAAKIDAGVLGVCTPASGWLEFGSTFAGLLVTRSGPIVTLEIMVKPSADKVCTAGAPTNIASIPAGFTPTVDRLMPILACPQAASSIVCVRGTVTAAGLVSFITPVTFTVSAAAGWISLVTAYRS